MLTRLDHVLLAMPPGGEERAREFYNGLLGLEEVAKPESLRALGGCWFEGAGIGVHLGVEKGFRPSPKAHVAFTVANLEHLQRRLEQAGHEVIPDDAVPGVARFYAFDPFGNRLEFIQHGQGFLGRDESISAPE